MTLSPKHRRFVSEYLKDQNAKQAAIRAGYSKKTAESQGSRLLSNAKVRAAVEAKLEKVEEKAIVDASYVLSSLKEIAERCMTNVPVMEFDHEEKAMVQKTVFESDPKSGMKELGIYEFDSTGANRALELLGKHLKLFTDKIEHTIHEGVFERLERGRKNASGA